jgi:hypothetical protein
MQRLTLLLFLFCVQHLGAQADPVGSRAANTLGTDAVPIANLAFSEPNRDAPLQLPSPIMSGGPTCGLDGRAFLRIMTPPPMYNYTEVYSITAGGVVAHYPASQIVGLQLPAVVAFDPGLSALTVLLRAASAGQTGPLLSGYYLVLFDYGGQLRKYSRLDLGLEPSSVAQLNDDLFLIMGADKASGRPRFVEVDSSGRMLRDLDSEAVMPSESVLKSALGSLNFGGAKLDDAPPSQRTHAVLSLFRPTHSDRDLLLLMPGADTQVTEMSRSGEVRTLRLKLPHDQVADSILPGKGIWFVRTYRVGTDGDWSLFEVDPDTGKAVRRVDTSDVPATSIACTTDSGGLYALRWIDQKAYILLGNLR